MPSWPSLSGSAHGQKVWNHLVWSSTAAMTSLCSHTNGIKQRYPTCWLCQYNRFMIDLQSNTLIIHLQWDYVLHVEHISGVFTNCGQHQRAILSLEEKHYQKITIPIFRDVLQNFAIPGYFPHILFYCYLFSLLSSGWFVIAVCGSISVRELVKYSESL